MTKKAATQEATERISYKDRISKREDIRRRLQALKEENSLVSSDAFNKRAIAHEADMALQRFQREIKNENQAYGHGRDKDFMDPWKKENFNKLKRADEAAEEAALNAERRKEAIAQEIDKLDSELENFGSLLGIDEVLCYQEDIASAEKKVADFGALIAGQEDIIEKARQSTPDSLDDLLRKREDLLADLSMGSATDKDLNALDKQIATQNEALEKFNKIAGNVGQIIAGLKRKLSAAEDDLNILQSRRQDVITEFLMGRAELLGQQYVKDAMRLIDSFKLLVAMDRIIGGYPSRLIGPISNGFAIPVFKLKAFDGLEQRGHYGQMEGTHKDEKIIQATVAEMSAEFSVAGINL